MMCTPAIRSLQSSVIAFELGALRPRLRLLSLGGRIAPPNTSGISRPASPAPAVALMGLGVHWLDLVEYVTGRWIVEIMAQISTHQRRRGAAWRKESVQKAG
jgi:hypothetical protein